MGRSQKRIEASSMLSLRVHKEASEEIQQAWSWYQQQTEGLGDDLIRELEMAFDSITTLPDAWPKFGRRARRFVLSRFPYAVVYVASRSEIHIVAVMHQSREPGYWRKRL